MKKLGRYILVLCPIRCQCKKYIPTIPFFIAQFLSCSVLEIEADSVMRVKPDMKFSTGLTVVPERDSFIHECIFVHVEWCHSHMSLASLFTQE